MVDSEQVHRERSRPWLTWGTLGVWGLVMITLCAYMLGGHLITLPTPDLDNPTLARAVTARRPEGAWGALHVLYGDCGCSRRVIRYLARRGPSALAHEHVVLVGPEPGDREALEGSGFPVELSDNQRLGEQFDIDAAPLFVVGAPDGSLRYVGGYTGRKRGPDIQDIRIIAAAIDGQAPPPLPLYGCAVNVELARTVDPLDLR